MSLPPAQSLPAWQYSTGTIVKWDNALAQSASANGALNLSSSATALTVLDVNNFRGVDSVISVEVTGKTGTGTTTLQVQAGNDNANWVNIGSALTLAGASPTLPASLSTTLSYYRYWRVYATIPTGDTITYQAYYSLLP